MCKFEKHNGKVYVEKKLGGKICENWNLNG